MKYDFDAPIDRRGTNAMSIHGYRDYLFGEREEVDIPYADDELISMWIADMEFRTSDAVLDALRDRIDHGVLGYSSDFDQKAKNAFIDWVDRRYGHRFSSHQVVDSPGVIHALKYFAGLCNPDDKILILTPSYAFFKHSAAAHGIDIVASPLVLRDGEYHIDFDDLAEKASDPSVTMTFLCSPHNPTGRLWTDDELKKYGQICLDNGVTIISDEIHCDLTRVGKSFTPMAKLFPDSDQIFTCMAPSKTFNLASMKYAYIVIPDQSILAKWKSEHSVSLNGLSLTATAAAYSGGEEWLEQLQGYLDQNLATLQQYLSEHLPLSKFSIPDATYLAWVDMSAYFDRIDEEPTYFLAKHAGVLTEGGKMFVSNEEGYIRLNIACPRERMLRGLERIKDAVLAESMS